jgi:UDP-4-amino-4,6-dideoxy-N-acetyl-beta-L-altrosamine transaminase
MTGNPLPYGRQVIDEDDIAAVVDALRSDFLTTGPAVDRFEHAFAAAVGAPHAVACANGTAALHLAALTLNLGPGDDVIVPALTFAATANAARYVGARVVFADVDPDTGMLTARTLDDALDRAPAARVVTAVHLNGNVAEMGAIAESCVTHGLELIEDACHAVGATYTRANNKEARVGACADSRMAAFSLHPVKTITMGEGGVVTTASAEDAARLRRLRNHGIVRDRSAFVLETQKNDAQGRANPWHYELVELGFNYRASDIHCALGLSQLAKLERFVARRRQLCARYDEILAPLAPIVLPMARATGCTPAQHLYAARVDFEAAGVSRATAMATLSDAGIFTQVHYMPLYRHPYYAEIEPQGPLPGAETYFSRCLSLPLFPAMSDADVERVADGLQRALGV